MTTPGTPLMPHMPETPAAGDGWCSQATMTVDLDAVRANWRILAARAPAAETGAVVKADAYGLGAGPVARALWTAGCRTFFVAHVLEGTALRTVLPAARIVVFHGIPPGTAPLFQAHGLIPAINAAEEWTEWEAAGAGPFALQVDTGLTRLGLSFQALAALAPRIPAPALVMSHLACGDDPNDGRTRQQAERFRAALALLPQAPASLLASSVMVQDPALAFACVRPGIALYGGNPGIGVPNPMRRAVTISAPILQVRFVDSGETVGYGATYQFRNPGRAAVAGIGYADGVMRAMSNRGWAAIGGTRVPIAGRVSMDLLTLDVSDVPSAARGAAVEITGPTIPLDEAAAAAGTLAYEFLTRLGPRVRRHYVGEAR